MPLKAVILAYMIRALLNLLLMTCRIKVEGLNKLVAAQKKGPCILMLWHNRLLIIGYVLSKFTPNFSYSAFISKSRDGEILAQFVNSYRKGHTIRVSHNARDRALRALILELKTKNNIVIMTPDGPRGPKYELKPGIVKAAAESSAAAIPCTWSVDRFWQLNSWDHLIIPKPFSTICVDFGTPLKVEENQINSLSLFQQGLEEITLNVCKRFTLRQELWPK